MIGGLSCEGPRSESVPKIDQRRKPDLPVEVGLWIASRGEAEEFEPEVADASVLSDDACTNLGESEKCSGKGERYFSISANESVYSSCVVVPSSPIAAKQTRKMKAIMTQYSTDVGPSSDLRNVFTLFRNWLMMESSGRLQAE